MRKRLITLALGAAALAATAMAQSTPAPGGGLPLPPPVEKELASRASSVTEVTLGKNMLAFASKFMNGRDEDEAATKKLIEGLDGVYVREYEFEKDGEFSMEEVEKLRQYFETTDWTPIVRHRSHRDGETADVMLRVVNGETKGMFVLSVEPRELTIVLILGPIRPEDLGRLTHIGGLGALGDIAEETKVKEKTKEKAKGKKGGTE